MGLSFIGFDTEHVKRYVFGTDKLKEIRGASSLLDYLNRIVMTQLADGYQAKTVYAHGGSGLFLIETKDADTFGKKVQEAYREVTGGGATVTYAVSRPLPEGIQDVDSDDDLTDILELLQWQIQEEKLHPPAPLTLPTHPFLRLCDACGLDYAIDTKSELRHVPRDPDEKDAQYCASCQCKRARNSEVKNFIKDIEAGQRVSLHEHLWDEIIPRLRSLEYDIPPLTEQPDDFDVFREFKGTKGYLGLIYADANNMGRHLENAHSILARKALANKVDDALYTAVCTTIARYLKVAEHIKPKEQQERNLKHPVFPFDILLLGGDDICMVVPASVAMDVALSLAETFHKETQKEHTLSVSVVLAPVKYPFGLLYDMAETTLKFAKRAGADARSASNGAAGDDTRINFLLVTGSSGNDFKAVYESTYHTENETERQDFYATLRPYAPMDLKRLLAAIRDKDGANLGRTKLHQMREAIFEMNLTTSVSGSLALLRNWREKQRDHVVRNVYETAAHQLIQQSNPADPVAGFPRVIFPWFKDGENSKNGYQIYRTPLLDFIELYDFLSREGGDRDQN